MVGEALPDLAQRGRPGGQGQRDPPVAAPGEAVPPAAAAVVEFPAGQLRLTEAEHRPDIEDYYISPWELAYGRSVSFNHDFIGRDALLAAKESSPRTEVTVTWGEHPGGGTAPDADLGFPRIRGPVAPAPYDAYAATRYRRH